VKAFVKTRDAVPLDEREVIRFLQQRLMNFQVPKTIHVVKDFPRNTMGKIDKKALRLLQDPHVFPEGV
jgi:acyl-coenzyme A synthetase/AMP-(fatty) acid ligase